MPSPVNVALRHQAYLEGVKRGLDGALEPVMRSMAVHLDVLLVQYGYNQVSDMPKRVLREFTAEFNRRAGKLLDNFAYDFDGRMKSLTHIDKVVTARNMRAMGKPVGQTNSADLYAALKRDPIPGTGHLPEAMLKDFLGTIRKQSNLLIKRAYSEKWTNPDLMKALTGTRARKFKDGLTNKLYSQWRAVEHTLVQNMHQWLNNRLGAMVYDAYQWVSILDAVTTDICRERHGKVYTNGGPRPPAHYNCRSTIIWIVGKRGFALPGDFYSWISSQPTAIQNDLLGRRTAQQLRAGKVGAKDLTKFGNRQTLLPGDLLKKQPNMVL